MRCMDRNKVAIWYAPYQGKSPVTDSGGNFTGEYTTTYGTPTKIMVNVSPSSGITQSEIFGGSEQYDKVIVSADVNLPITEYSVLWIDTPYTTNVPHDYVVKRIAKSINSVSIAVSKVDVRG